MSTKKIGELPKSCGAVCCRDREHNPPSMQVFEPGVYEHTCPGCGKKQTFVVHEGPSL